MQKRSKAAIHNDHRILDAHARRIDAAQAHLESLIRGQVRAGAMSVGDAIKKNREEHWIVRNPIHSEWSYSPHEVIAVNSGQRRQRAGEEGSDAQNRIRQGFIDGNHGSAEQFDILHQALDDYESVFIERHANLQLDESDSSRERAKAWEDSGLGDHDSYYEAIGEFRNGTQNIRKLAGERDELDLQLEDAKTRPGKALVRRKITNKNKEITAANDSILNYTERLGTCAREKKPFYVTEEPKPPEPPKTPPEALGPAHPQIQNPHEIIAGLYGHTIKPEWSVGKAVSEVARQHKEKNLPSFGDMSDLLHNPSLAMAADLGIELHMTNRSDPEKLEEAIRTRWRDLGLGTDEDLAEFRKNYTDMRARQFELARERVAIQSGKK